MESGQISRCAGAWDRGECQSILFSFPTLRRAVAGPESNVRLIMKRAFDACALNLSENSPIALITLPPGKYLLVIVHGQARVRSEWLSPLQPLCHSMPRYT